MKNLIPFFILFLINQNVNAQWTNLNAPERGYYKIAVSADGQNIAAYSSYYNQVSSAMEYNYVISHDGGANWSEYETINMAPQQLFWDGNILYTQESDNFNTLRKSIDYGASYEDVNTSYAATRNVIINSAGRYFISTNIGTLDYSDNQGQTWNVASNINFSGLLDAAYAPNGNLVVTTEYGVIYSTDNGDNWNSATGPGDVWTLQDRHSIDVLDNGTMVIKDSGIRISTDNGVSWTDVNVATAAPMPIGYYAEGNNIVCGSLTGTGYISSDMGLNFSYTSTANQPLIAGGDMDRSVSNIYYCGTQGIFRYEGNSQDIAENAATDIQVYPNPSATGVRISGLKSNIGQLYLYNATGHLMMERKNVNFSEEIMLNQLSSGVYQLVVFDLEGKMHSAKIIH